MKSHDDTMQGIQAREHNELMDRLRNGAITLKEALEEGEEVAVIETDWMMEILEEEKENEEDE